MTMLIRRIVFPIAACLFAAAMLADEPECASNYKSDATSSQTSVVTTLVPKAVIEALPYRLAAAGATMEWSEPLKGILKAGSLDVRAEASGSVTRVTFHASPAADKATLCRYATLVGNPPLSAPPPVAQDPAAIAQMKNDLLLKHQIVQPGIGDGINHATFQSIDDFLQFAITGIKDLPNGKREYTVSMLLPRNRCSIAMEDMNDVTSGMSGKVGQLHAKPGHVDATLTYAKDVAGWKLTDAFITKIESAK